MTNMRGKRKTKAKEAPFLLKKDIMFLVGIVVFVVLAATIQFLTKQPVASQVTENFEEDFDQVELTWIDDIAKESVKAEENQDEWWAEHSKPESLRPKNEIPVDGLLHVPILPKDKGGKVIIWVRDDNEYDPTHSRPLQCTGSTGQSCFACHAN